ncbi:enoyl-CoA hydratase/isomerase family protein [Tundrisphaera lichenicola]|uniref:enoyl-CoA hydratase/isomerase family protein n=1 Tax=Tundrisphaera lichenicola TaxID=2029860 RepID=UPI003EBA6F46
MTESTLLVERPCPGIAELVLNRPDRRNALNYALMAEIVGAIEELSADTSCRVLILRGEGPVFCAGLDLHETLDPAFSESTAQGVGRVLSLIASTPLVTIAVAHGVASAGGAGLLAACDFAIVSEELKIVFPEVRRGLVPALVATVLRKKLKDADLRELFLLAEPIDANRARSMGLVHRVVARNCLREEARRIASLVLQGAPQAVQSTKELLASLGSSVDREASEIALEYHIQARIGVEAREGLAAFLEKREPRWG